MSPSRSVDVGHSSQLSLNFTSPAAFSCLIKEACDGLFEGEGDDSFGGAAVALPLDDLGVADGHEEGQRALLERVAHHAPL